MSQEQRERGDPVGFRDYLRLLPHEPVASSDLGWVEVEAHDCRAAPAFELNLPALTHHRLSLFACPPEELDLRGGEAERTASRRIDLAAAGRQPGAGALERV